MRPYKTIKVILYYSQFDSETNCEISCKNTSNGFLHLAHKSIKKTNWMYQMLKKIVAYGRRLELEC